MDHLTERTRWGLVTILVAGAVCGATAALLARKRRAAMHEADLDARSRDMVAEGAPAGVLATEHG